MKRVVRPELLDQLPATDSRAVESRADLRRLNRCMGHARIAARVLGSLAKERGIQRLIDLGAGEAIFTCEVLKHLGGHEASRQLLVVDQQDLVSEQTQRTMGELGWSVQKVKADVFEFLKAAPESDLVLANLFLHHFEPERLHDLFQELRDRTGAFVALEPRRGWIPYVFSRMVGLIGCNDVTRHDAPVSVRAGFAGKEVSTLWPQDSRWRLQERQAGLFSHLFVAQKLER